MTALIELRGVNLTYPIYSVRAQSLRNTLANLAVGGKLLKDSQDIIHVRALENVSFTLEDGDRLGLIGHNGAGKTTLLKILAGVYEPDQGLVSVNGRIASMIDINLGMDVALTGRENIINMGRIRGYTTRQILAKMDDIVAFSDLGQFIDLPMRTYSAGMMARLVFAVATSLDPDILLMDEWLGAGDQDFLEKASTRLTDILHRSRVIVLASHNTALIKKMCNKLLVLESGSQVFFGDIGDWDIGAQRLMSETRAIEAAAAKAREAERLASLAKAAAEQLAPSADPAPEAGAPETKQDETPKGAVPLDGKNGWLFLSGDSNNVIGQHTGDVSLSTEGVEAWKKLLATRARKVKEMGGKGYYFLVAPDTHAVYPEFLPDDIVPAASRPVMEVQKAVKSLKTVNFIYPLDALRAERGERLVACTTDTHWTHNGAFTAYRALMEAVAKKAPKVRILERREVFFTDTDYVGDLGGKLLPPVTGRNVTAIPVARKAKRIYQNHIPNRGHVQIYENEDKQLPSAVFFHDSYGWHLAHFLAESFSRLVMVQTPLVEYDYLEEERPDIVISEMVERFLIRTPDDAADPSSKQMAEIKAGASAA